MTGKYFLRMLAVTLLTSVSIISNAQADSDEDGRQGTVTSAKWKNECGACHVAYPPRFLPAESWRAIMSGLDRHFGSNASLDAASIREITDFLEKNASKKQRERSDKPLLRITETRWFKSEHGEVKASVWKNPRVKSPANCNACHTLAERGNFGEHSLKIPQ